MKSYSKLHSKLGKEEAKEKLYGILNEEDKPGQLFERNNRITNLNALDAKKRKRDRLKKTSSKKLVFRISIIHYDIFRFKVFLFFYYTYS